MSTKKYGLVANVLIVIICSLLIINFMRLASAGQILTFEGFITNLSSVYTLPLPTLNNLVITADWGIFNFFKDFLNLFTCLLTLGIYFSTSVVNALLIVLQLVKIILPM